MNDYRVTISIQYMLFIVMLLMALPSQAKVISILSLEREADMAVHEFSSVRDELSVKLKAANNKARASREQVSALMENPKIESSVLHRARVTMAADEAGRVTALAAALTHEEKTLKTKFDIFANAARDVGSDDETGLKGLFSARERTPFQLLLQKSQADMELSRTVMKASIQQAGFHDSGRIAAIFDASDPSNIVNRVAPQTMGELLGAPNFTAKSSIVEPLLDKIYELSARINTASATKNTLKEYAQGLSLIIENLGPSAFKPEQDALTSGTSPLY